MSEPEFSRPVRLDTIGAGSRTIEIAAERDERTALARRFGLLALKQLGASAELVRLGEEVSATGRLRAEVEQPCVASGEPVPATIDEPFALRFIPEGETSGEEIELDEDDLDVLPYTGGAIDLGEAVAQTLALALDPFPRSADAEAALRAAGVIDEEEAGPFSALKALRDRL